MGIVLGIVLLKLTGWLALDAIIALIVSANIVWAGVRLLRETGSELLDAALPATDQDAIAQVFNE